MDILHSIILGIVEGVTEFLPISSTGHLILASNLLQISQSEFVKTFEIFIQSGSILAVIVLYWKKIISNLELAKRVAVAFIPTAIVGFVLYKLIKHYLIGNTDVVLLSLLIGGIALIGAEMLFARRKSHVEIRDNEARKATRSTSSAQASETLTYEKAAVIGLFQSIAVIPGVSRSASTIVGGMLLGISREEATEFSFLLAVPTMIAATALDLKSSSFSFDSNQWMMLAVGFVVSFVVALAAIKWLIKYVQHHNFIPFGLYRIVLAVLYFLILAR